MVTTGSYTLTPEDLRIVHKDEWEEFLKWRHNSQYQIVIATPDSERYHNYSEHPSLPWPSSTIAHIIFEHKGPDDPTKKLSKFLIKWSEQSFKNYEKSLDKRKEVVDKLKPLRMNLFQLIKWWFKHREK